MEKRVTAYQARSYKISARKGLSDIDTKKQDLIDESINQ